MANPTKMHSVKALVNLCILVLKTKRIATYLPHATNTASARSEKTIWYYDCSLRLYSPADIQLDPEMWFKLFVLADSYCLEVTIKESD